MFFFFLSLHPSPLQAKHDTCTGSNSMGEGEPFFSQYRYRIELTHPLSLFQIWKYPNLKLTLRANLSGLLEFWVNHFGQPEKTQICQFIRAFPGLDLILMWEKGSVEILRKAILSFSRGAGELEPVFGCPAHHTSLSTSRS